MSGLKPAVKRNRATMETQSTLERSKSVALPRELSAEEKDPLTASNLQTQEMMDPSKKKDLHPKGHKVQDLAEVWNTMDKQDFLRITDTLTLGDVWVQPISCIPVKGDFCKVTLREIVYAPHIKSRIATCKMSNDDMLKILFLNDKFLGELQGLDVFTYDDWLNEKAAKCIKAKGRDEVSDHAKIANFILTEDKEFTFYPRFPRGANFGMFFRKICYHSYKTNGSTAISEQKGTKLINPSMLKCGATAKRKFEYIIEARMFPLPDQWFDDVKEFTDGDGDDEVPESQALL